MLRSSKYDGSLSGKTRLRLLLRLLFLDLLADKFAENAGLWLLLKLFVVMVSLLLLLLHFLVHRFLELEFFHIVAAGDEAFWNVQAEQLLVVELEFGTWNLALLNQLFLWIYLKQYVTDVFQRRL